MPLYRPLLTLKRNHSTPVSLVGNREMIFHQEHSRRSVSTPSQFQNCPNCEVRLATRLPLCENWNKFSFCCILGIEAVGIVEEAPVGTFHIGGNVVTAMGGWSVDGSYAEYLR